MLRIEIANGTDLGVKAKQIMDTGGLVSDEIIIGMIANRIDQPDCARGVIFDGFPRTVPQAQALDAMLKEKGRKLDAVIQLQVDEEILVGRLKSRVDEMKAAGHEVRSDDNEETLRKRLETFHAQTAPIIPYYAGNGRLRIVDGMKTIDDVENQIATILNSLKAA
jgi:adenylate kinase